MSGVTNRCVVVGGGVFGLPAAIELRRRGWQVELIDPGPLPHPDAASTDISKAVRMDYGSDAFYQRLAHRAIRRWREWNQRWQRAVYHEVGFLLATRSPMTPGDFEYEGMRLAADAGVPVTRLAGGALPGRVPLENESIYVDGYFNPAAGWAASGEVIALLAAEAQQAGVQIRAGESMDRLTQRDDRIDGVLTRRGRTIAADRVVVAAGAWTPLLLPDLADRMTPTAHQVFHLRPEDATWPGEGPFPVWGADIARTGWYGFPPTADGIVKIGNHGPGLPVDPTAPRPVDRGMTERFREFVRESFPRLDRAPLVEQRACLYCDSWDGDFYLAEDPGRPGLVVASGGSGHGFKFAPVLGELVADVVERRHRPELERFRWRDAGSRRTEQARRGD